MGQKSSFEDKLCLLILEGLFMGVVFKRYSKVKVGGSNMKVLKGKIR
jgi:hypothetical protein